MNIYKNYYRNLIEENRQILYPLLLPDNEEEEKFNSLLASKLKAKGSQIENSLSTDKDFLLIFLNEIIEECGDDSPKIQNFKNLVKETLVSSKDSDLEFFFWFLSDIYSNLEASNQSKGTSGSIEEVSRTKKRYQQKPRKNSKRKAKALKTRNERNRSNQ